MLYEFLNANRGEIISRAREKASGRQVPGTTKEDLENGIPMVLSQLVEMLQAPPPTSGNADISASATMHGDDMRRQGFTVAQVVQDYAGLCQAITELAVEQEAAIGADEFKTLNSVLDGAVASAVTEFGRQQEQSIFDQGNEQLGVLAHELRNALHTATLGFDAMHSGIVGPTGSTSGIVASSLARMRDLLEGSLETVRSKAGLRRRNPVSVGAIIEQVTVPAMVDASNRGLQLTVGGSISADVKINVDAATLVAALSNLLQNALKFTRPHGRVCVNVHATDRVQIEIEDECGGLPAGTIEDLFCFFEQRGADRTGLGLGLGISRQGVEENGGAIHVRDLPGKGCVFTVDLPRQM